MQFLLNIQAFVVAHVYVTYEATKIKDDGSLITETSMETISFKVSDGTSFFMNSINDKIVEESFKKHMEDQDKFYKEYMEPRYKSRYLYGSCKYISYEIGYIEFKIN